MDSVVQGLQGLMALGPILKLMQSSNPSPLDKFDTRVTVGAYTTKVLDEVLDLKQHCAQTLLNYTLTPQHGFTKLPKPALLCASALPI